MKVLYYKRVHREREGKSVDKTRVTQANENPENKSQHNLSLSL
jgi:hypothetical protein